MIRPVTVGANSDSRQPSVGANFDSRQVLSPRVANRNSLPPLLVAWALLVTSLCISHAADAPAFVPPWFADAVIYHNAFEGQPAEADVNLPGLMPDLAFRQGGGEPPPKPVETTGAGLFGRGLHVQDWRAPLLFRHPSLSPHRPLTLCFWWALPYDLTIDGGYSLFSLNGKGMIALFSRGKGEWCALQKPAGVFQVYYFQGIQNVNGIYDFDLLAHYDLRAGVWHHTAVVFRRATTVQVYTDGKLVSDVTISGREFSADDNLTHLSLGGPLYLDELMVLDRAVEADMIADYVTGIQRLREYLASP